MGYSGPIFTARAKRRHPAPNGAKRRADHTTKQGALLNHGGPGGPKRAQEGPGGPRRTGCRAGPRSAREARTGGLAGPSRHRRGPGCQCPRGALWVPLNWTGTLIFIFSAAVLSHSTWRRCVEPQEPATLAPHRQLQVTSVTSVTPRERTACGNRSPFRLLHRPECLLDPLE